MTGNIYKMPTFSPAVQGAMTEKKGECENSQNRREQALQKATLGAEVTRRVHLTMGRRGPASS